MENKNTTLNKRLKSYSALAGTIFAAANTANAQVVYTNVTPDSTITTGGSYDLDLDNDGTADFVLGVTSGAYTYGSFTIPYNLGTISANTANAIDTSTTQFSAEHNTNDAINSSLNWADPSTTSYQVLGFAPGGAFAGYNYGNFVGATNKFIGLRFQIDGLDHYGWVRIDMASDGSTITIKDYAYDATPGATSYCGQTVTGIKEHNTMKEVTIFSANKTINVNMNNTPLQGIVSVTNSMGQEVANVKVTDAQMTIPMDNASTGIYFVTVTQENARFTKKVIVQ